MDGTRAQPYLALVHHRAPAPAWAWFEPKLRALGPPLDRMAFGLAYAGTGRRMGSEPVMLEAAEREAIDASGLLLPEGWPLRHVARAALLLCATEHLAPREHPRLVRDVFRRGDNAEREAVLRTLPMLPEPERHLDTAVDACRTNVQTVFEAIACDNPYPARHFPDLNFHQLVLKALFTGAPLDRMIGLRERTTDELVQKVGDYVSERRAAGRSIPDDVTLIESAKRGER